MSKIRLCQICNDHIPNQAIVNGKTVILSSRKRCLKCSPYGFQGKKTGIPGNISKRMDNYANWNAEWKKEHQNKSLIKGKERKQKLVTLHGDKCKKCNYEGPLRCMSFHHIVPQEKKFTLDASSIRGKNWDEVVEESNKCELLCIRCHAEIEHEIINAEVF